MANDGSVKKSGLATASLVMGIVGISLSFIPILNNASIILGILAVIFGIIPLTKKLAKGKAIAGLIMGILAVVIAIALQSSWSNAIDDISDDLNTATGGNTEKVLENLDISIGTFEVTTNEYGWEDTKLTVKVTNRADEKVSYSITIEADDSNGDKLDDDVIYADLSAGQSQSFDLFEYVDSDLVDDLQNATFKVSEASSY